MAPAAQISKNLILKIAAFGMVLAPAAAWGQTTVNYVGKPLYDPAQSSITLCNGASETGIARCALLLPPDYQGGQSALIQAGSPPAVTYLQTPAGSPYGQFTSPSNDGTWLAGSYDDSGVSRGFVDNIAKASYQIVDLPQWSSKRVLLTGITAINKSSTVSAPEFAGGFAYANTSTCGQPFRYLSGRFVKLTITSPCAFVSVEAESNNNAIAGTIGNLLLFAPAGGKAITVKVPGVSAPQSGQQALNVFGVEGDNVGGTTDKGTGFIYNSTTGHTAPLPTIATPAGPISPGVIGLFKSPQGGKYLVRTMPQQTGFTGTYIYDGSTYSPVQITVTPVVAGDTVTGVYPAAIEENGTITGSFTETCNGSGCTNVNQSGFIAIPAK